MVLILLLGVLLITVATVIILYPSKKIDKKHIIISLKDLSSIWTKYNEAIDNIEIQTAPTDELDVLFTQEETIKDKDYTITSVPSSVSNSVITQESVKTVDFSSLIEPLKSFWKDCIQPYKTLFDEQNVSDVLKNLIEILEKHGHHPSVVMDNRDQEAIDLISIKDSLGKISLKEHSYSVVRNMLSIIKENYIDYENHIPKAIITALAHDIGKIPELRLSNIYNTAEHPIVSINKLNELFAGKNIFWLKQVIKAISEHHIYSEDQWTNFLKQADRMARQQELLSFTKEYQIKKFSDWFNHEELLKSIEPYINVSQEGQKWQAISFGNIVYCRPDFIYEKAKELCRKNKVLDLIFIYESEKGNAIREVVNRLKEKDLIPDILKANFVSRRFEIHYSMGQRPQKYMLIPIKTSVFNIEELERRKTKGLLTIEKIIPA